MIKHETRESVILLNDNQKIFAVFHKPVNLDSLKKIPAVLFCHGFAGQKTGKYRLYVTLAEELAKNGIASLRIDFRGCGDSEGDFLNTSLKSEVSDALKGLDFLSNVTDIDSTRLGIFGRSLGGAVAVMAAKNFNQIKSLALWAPLFTAESWYEKWQILKKNNLTDDEIKQAMIVNGQLIGNDFLKQLFSMRLELDLECLNEIPILHIHAEKDQVVNVSHAQKYEHFRANAAAETEFMTLKSSDHDFSDLEERNEAVKKTVSWFKRTL